MGAHHRWLPPLVRTVDTMTFPPPAAPRRKRRWRRIVAWTAATVVALVAVGAGIFAWAYAGADVSTAGKLDFDNRLRIPELLEGERGADGVVRFELDVQAGVTQLRGGPTTETWGVNGTYLGPTLRAARGDEVEIAVRNGVDEATTMHWHGMHLPARMDGGPHQPIEPGETWSPTWTIDQPAATLWYHPHPHGDTADHVHRGVAGMFILDDDQSIRLDLPHNYGVDDLPVIIQDRSFDDENQFDGDERGDELLVNGTHDPHVDVTHERVRLRLLNASDSRFYDLGFVDGRTFQLIGTDGGLLPSPVTVDRVPLSPGERAEIVATFEPSEDAVLRSFPRGSGGGFFVDRFDGHDDTFDVLQFRAADDLISSPQLPATLADVERLDPSQAVTTRTFRLSGTQINGEDMDMDRIDATVTAGTVEIWEVTAGGGAHNFHVHGVQFQVLDLDGAPPPDHLRGWKDTVEARADTTTRLIVPFTSHTDPDAPYMFHCHKLRHEDRGMMGQFVVVEPGQAAGTPPSGHDHD
jgi:FtsP/CotA-like multicopper oxidase with cupredoxin domain